MRQRDGTFLITGAHVIVGDGREFASADVRIVGARIEEVRPEGGIDPAGAEIIDGRGKTLIPGLIDAHAHLDLLTARGALHARWIAATRIRRALGELLRHGVTTVRCMGDPAAIALTIRDRIERGRISGPRLLVAGPVLTAPGGHPATTVAHGNRWLRRRLAVELDDAEHARAVVRRLHARGVDHVKLVFQGGRYGESGLVLGKLAAPVMRAIVAEAHALGLPVSTHTHHQSDVDEALAASADSIEHGVIEEDLQDTGTLQRWAGSGARLVPTLYIATLTRDWEGRSYHATAARNLRRAHEAGVRIVAGTDAMIGALPPTALHEELRLMVAAGIPPRDALRMATGDAAAALGMTDRGLVSEGRVADLVLLGADPHERIEHVGDVTAVFRGGRLVHRSEAPAIPELAPYRTPGPAVARYVDETLATVPAPAVVEYDTSRFTSEGVRELRYADAQTGAVLRTETITSSAALATERWRCVIPGEDTELEAVRSGQTLVLAGRFQGAPVSRSYPLRGRLWLQAFLFDAAVFATSPHERLPFVALGTSGRGALVLTDFELTKTGRRKEDGIATVSTELVMPQWRRFWSAEGLYDATTGALLRHHARGRASASLHRQGG